MDADILKRRHHPKPTLLGPGKILVGERILYVLAFLLYNEVLKDLSSHLILEREKEGGGREEAEQQVPEALNS